MTINVRIRPDLRIFNRLHVLKLGCLSALVLAVSPWSAWAAEPSAPTPSPNAALELSQMFSQEIRDTLNACVDGGGVNLSKGANTDGSVICKEAKQTSKVAYTTYLTTFADFVSAGFLVGFRTALQDDPQAKSNAVAIQELFKSNDGENMLHQVLTSALAKTQAVASDSPESLEILVKEVLKRTQPVLKDPSALDSLFGSPATYDKVVKKFCSLPGMSVVKAQSEIPGTSPLQLFASCIQASGLPKEVSTEAAPKKPSNP